MEVEVLAVVEVRGQIYYLSIGGFQLLSLMSLPGMQSLIGSLRERFLCLMCDKQITLNA